MQWLHAMVSLLASVLHDESAWPLSIQQTHNDLGYQQCTFFSAKTTSPIRMQLARPIWPGVACRDAV